MKICGIPIQEHPYANAPELWSYEDEPDVDCKDDDDCEPPEPVFTPPPAIRGVEWPYTLDDYQQAVGIKPWE